MKLRSSISAFLLVVATAASASPAKVHRVKNVMRLDGDVSRLESILQTTQNRSLPRSSLLPTANEANMLANRIWAGVHRSYRGRASAVDAATQLRMHIRAMHKAAANGDVAGVQLHAREALPFAYRIDDLR